MATAALASESTADPTEIFRRAASVEERVGRVELRRAYATRLQVLVDCKEDRRGCIEETVYDEVVRLDFLLTEQEVRGDTVERVEDPIGTIYLATTFEQADHQAFWSELRTLMRRLSADSFNQPFAGWGPMQAPFDKQTLSTRSMLPSWACFELGSGTTTVRFDRMVDDSSVLGVRTQVYGDPPSDVCEEMSIATEGVYPDVYHTLSSPTRLRELIVEHEDLVRLDTDDPRSLLDRPEGIQLVKQKARTGFSAESASQAGDSGLSRATRIENGWRFDVWTEPVELPIAALDQNAWLHVWTFSTVERSFGADPVERLVERSTLSAAFLATVPAAQPSDPWPDGSYPLSESGRLAIELEDPVREEPPRIDRRVFLEDLLEGLARHSGAPEDLIVPFLRQPAAGLGSEGWLVVVCHDDGSATYFVPPTKAENRVTNADQFCGALETRLH